MKRRLFRNLITIFLVISMVFSAPLSSFAYTNVTNIGTGSHEKTYPVPVAPGAPGITADITGTTLTISGTGKIPDNAFAKDKEKYYDNQLAKITKIVIKKGITEIDRYAFTGCVNVTTLELNEGLRTIFVGAFKECTKLTTVTIPNSVRFIQNDAFNYPKPTLKILAKDILTKNPNSKNEYWVRDTLTFNAVADYSNAFLAYKKVNNWRGRDVDSNGNFITLKSDLSKYKTVREQLYGSKDILSGLTMDVDLQTCAMERAAELAITFDHNRPNGESCFTINGAVLSEICAAGGTSGTTIADKLLERKKEPSKEDPNKQVYVITDNQKNLLSKTYKYIGVGCVLHNGINYWVILLSKDPINTKTKYNPQKQGNTTNAFTVPFPYGTNKIILDRTGGPHTHNFKINPTSIKLAKGETKKATLKHYNEAIDFISAKDDKGKYTSSWSTSNSNVASVSQTGVITAKGYGTATIKAGSTMTKRASITVTVFDALRLAGATRYRTGIEIAKKYRKDYGKQLDSIIIATGDNYPDALAGGYLGKVKNAPILLVPSKSNANTKEAYSFIWSNVKRGGTIYILGGTGSVPADVDNTLKSQYKIKRFAGSSRYDTNLMILKETGVSNTEVLVTTGLDYKDALIASAVGLPLLVVDKSGLLPSQKNFLKGRGITKFTIIGNTSDVPNILKTQLKSYSKTTNVDRVYGTNCYETSKLVADKYFSKATSMVLAQGSNFPDALAGGPFACSKKSPILLVDGSSHQYKYAVAYAKSKNIRFGYVLGGTGSVPDGVWKAVFGW